MGHADGVGEADLRGTATDQLGATVDDALLVDQAFERAAESDGHRYVDGASGGPRVADHRVEVGERLPRHCG